MLIPLARESFLSCRRNNKIHEYWMKYRYRFRYLSIWQILKASDNFLRITRQHRPTSAWRQRNTSCCLATVSTKTRAFAPLPRASRSVFVYIGYIFLAPSSAFEARLVGKSNLSLAYRFSTEKNAFHQLWIERRTILHPNLISWRDASE